MRKFSWWKTGLVVVNLVTLLVILVIVRLVTLDPNDYKDWIADRFEGQTGLALTLGGPIAVSYYPWVDLTVSDVTVGNAPGFSEQPLLTAADAQVRVKLLPALRGRYEIDTVRLHGVQVNLEVDENGTGNWAYLSGSGDAAPADASGGGLPLTNLIIGGVDVADVALRYEDRRSGAIHQVSDLKFSIAELVFGVPIELALTLNATTNQPELGAGLNVAGTLNYDLDNGRYQLAPLALQARLEGETLPGGSADLQLDGALEIDLDSDTLAINELVLSGLDSTLQVQVQGRNISTDRAVYETTLDLQGGDLATLFRAAGVTELANQLAQVQNRAIVLSTAAVIDSGRDSADISRLTASLLGAELEGAFQVSSLRSQQPAVEGRISTSGPDLPLVVEVVGQVSGGRDSALSQLGRELRRAPDRAFSIDASFAANPGAGSVNVPSLEARLVGATISAELNGENLASEAPVLQGNVNASGPDLPLLLELAGQLTGGNDAILSDAGRELRRAPERSFIVNARFDADLGAGSVSVPTLDARLAGASIQGNLNGTAITSDAPVLRGNLNASGPDLPLFLQIGGRIQGAESFLNQFAGNLAGTVTRPFTIASEFDVDLDNGNINVPQLTLNALDLRLDGQMTARNMNARNGSINGTAQLESSRPGPLLAAAGQADLAEVLERVSVNMQVSGSRADLLIEPLSATLVASGPRIPNSPATIGLNASTRLNLDQETLAMESFSVNGLGLDAKGTVNAEGIFDAPRFNGRLELASFNLRRFLQQMNLPVPDTSDPAVLQRVAVSAAFAGSTDAVSVQDLNLVLDDTNVRGELAVNSFERTDITFDITVDGINADRYLSSAPDTAAPASGAAVTDSAGGTEIPVEQLRALVLDGQLDIGQLTLSGLELSDLSLAVTAGDGDLRLAPLSANLYDGSFSGTAGLSVAGAQPQMNLQTSLANVNLEPLLFDLLSATYVTGLSNIELSLQGSGADTGALKQSLSGSGRLQIEDGVLSGVDVASVLRQLETMIRRRQAGTLERGQQTAFESFSSTLAINNGVIRTNDLLIRSPGFQVTGSGTLLDLASNAIAFDLVTSVDRSTATVNTEEYDIGGYSLPIACSGSLSNPRCLPDAGEILRIAVRQELQERVTNLLDRAIGVERQDQSGQSTGTQPEQQPQNTAPQQQDPQQPPQQEQEQPNVRDELINRALNRIFN